MTGPTTGALARIAQARVLPVLRADDPSVARALAGRLVGAGLAVLEVTTSIPSWPDVIAGLREQFPEACVGAGTVVDATQARQALAAGAQFCVSPCAAPEVRRALHGSDAPFIEGGLTPSEVIASARHGVAKLFPAHVGGIAYLRSLLAVAPSALIIPTGGIALSHARQWLEAGAFAVGVGGDLANADDLRAELAEVMR